ncbi:cytochrome P450 2B19-like [Glandiceps talaboti]
MEERVYLLWNISPTMFIIIMLLALLCGVIVVDIINKRRFPPGPWGYPLLGCLPSVDHKLPLTFMKWADKYGDIFSVTLGTQTFVVLNKYDVHRDALRRVELAGRPTHSLLRMILGDRGIACQQYNDVWREQRHFVVELFNRRLGTFTIEVRIQEEAQALCKNLTKKIWHELDLSRDLQKVVGNVICYVCFGRRFDYDDPTFCHLLQMFDEFSHNIMSTSVIDFFPFLRHFNLPIYSRVNDPFNDILDFAKKEINNHRDTFDDDNIRDFIDAYLSRMEQDTRSGRSTSFTDENLAQGVFELFFGGINTTFYTLTWVFLYMINFPEIQDRIHKELDDVLAGSETLHISDRDKLPYTNACLQEIYRHASVAWMGGPHEANKDVDINGYMVPKGTTVFMNIWSVHYDSKYWNNPEKFDPLRFLDENGQVRTPAAFVPFSLGRRECMGKGLANMSSFLIAATLLKNFKFKVADNHNIPAVSEGKFGPVHFPPPYFVNVLPR